MLNLQKFIIKNKDWKEKLSQKPYCLKISEEGNLILFKYNQIDSDFNEPIVNESRGIILEKDTWKVVAYAFNKFFNFGESYADEIDWESAVVETKEDGSLIKVYYYDGEWRVGTNGTIFAENAELNAGPYKNFRELFDAAAEKCGFNFSRLNRYYTYVLELCSPFNIIICPQSEMRLIHIGTRNNRTFQEVETDIGIPHPQRYNLSSLEDCIAMAQTFDFTKEGFVVKDKNYNRIKIKSLDYLKAHRLANNSNINTEHAIDIIKMNEIEEFLSYFPFYTDFILTIKTKIGNLISIINDEIKKALNVRSLVSTRKEFSITANDSIYPFIWYNVYNNPDYTATTFINSLTSKQLAKYISNI